MLWLYDKVSWWWRLTSRHSANIDLYQSDTEESNLNPKNPETQTITTIDIEIPKGFNPKLPDWAVRAEGLNSQRGELTLEPKELVMSIDDWLPLREFVQRAQKMNPAGFTEAMFLYKKRRLIPKELRKARLFFPRTILEESTGTPSVFYMYWDSIGRDWAYAWLCQGSMTPGALVVCLKSADESPPRGQDPRYTEEGSCYNDDDRDWIPQPFPPS